MCRNYAGYKDRFEIWCGFDYTGYDKPGFAASAVEELERCHRMGAKGVGELGDKGLGELYSRPVQGIGMHLDDPRMKPLLAKCAELNMPINIHVADPIWMYEKMDSTNDGLMNALEWRIDMSKPGILGLRNLSIHLKIPCKEIRKPLLSPVIMPISCTTWDNWDDLFDNYPNLYADISARYAETATIPRYMKAFIEKYQDRLLYGTDMGS